MKINLFLLIILVLILIFTIFKKNINEKFVNYNSLNDIYKVEFSLKNIRYVHGVPEVVFIVWFGNNISDNRLKALNSLINNLKVPYIIITDKNYKSFELKNKPFHKAFEYLSGNHKSDYLRAYLLNYYGGGYHDIKYRSNSGVLLTMVKTIK